MRFSLNSAKVYELRKFKVSEIIQIFVPELKRDNFDLSTLIKQFVNCYQMMLIWSHAISFYY